MKSPRSLLAIATLAALLAAAVGPSSAAACCRPGGAAVAAACGACCSQASVCAPRSADEATASRAFSLAAPAATGPVIVSAHENRDIGRLRNAPQSHASATPTHLSHIPLLV